MKVGIDTDGILDRCSCGERAGFFLTREGWVAACSELCGEQTPAYGDRSEAMAAWNKDRREAMASWHKDRRAERRRACRAKIDRLGVVGVWLLTGAVWAGVIWLFILWRRLEGEA